MEAINLALNHFGHTLAGYAQGAAWGISQTFSWDLFLIVALVLIGTFRALRSEAKK